MNDPRSADFDEAAGVSPAVQGEPGAPLAGADPTDAERPLAWLLAIERAAAAGLVAVVFGLMAAQVVARYVLGTPIPWSEEVACFAFVWLAFLGAAMVAGEGAHLTVDVVTPSLGRRGRQAVEWFSAAIVVLCCAMMIVGGTPVVRRLGAVASPAAGIARRWWYLASAVGLALIALHTVVHAGRGIRGEGRGAREEERGGVV